MDHPGGQPFDIDVTRPSAARVYDYFLGGAHNFEADRQLAEQIASQTPNLAETMRANRSFLLISHATQDGQPPEVLEAQRLSSRTDTTIALRPHADIERFFGDLVLADPGLVFLTRWRPDPQAPPEEHPERVGAFGGVARR